MSGKFWTKLTAGIVIVLFVVAFREAIITDSEISTVFGELMGTLPFAKTITDIVCKVLKYSVSSAPVSVHVDVVKDSLKLLVMACIQPFAVGMMTKLFLPLPKHSANANSYDVQEEYMNSTGYKMKELIVTIIMAPLLALLSAYLTDSIFSYICNNYGGVGKIFISILSAIIVFGFSLFPLMRAKIAIGTIIAWRLSITLGSKIISTFITNCLCMALYIAIVNGVSSQISTTVIVFVAWLIISDIGIGLMKRAITR